MFQLNNSDRKYLGLDLIQDSWDRFVLNDEITLFFDQNKIVKKISHGGYSYEECEMDEITDNREFILPKTNRGKPKKLNFTSVNSKKGIGVYFKYSKPYITIGNYTSQTTFYSTYFEDTRIESFEELRDWIDRFSKDTNDRDLLEIRSFKSSKRRNIKYREGDFFSFKVDRRNFGFGRLLMDVGNYRKSTEFKSSKNYGLGNLMGVPLLVKVYHIVQPRKEIDLQFLKSQKSFPSKFIMDNALFYGDYEIIGNHELEEDEMDPPIQFGRSISALDPKTVYLQYGKIYKSTNLENFSKYLDMNFEMNGIGFDLGIKKQTLLKCIESGDNEPFWKENNYWRLKDLRNPMYEVERTEILEFFDLDLS